MHAQTAVNSFDPDSFLTWSAVSSARDTQDRRAEGERMRGLQLGQLNILLCEGHGMQAGYRDLDHIQVDHADNFVLTVPVSARLLIRQDGVNAQIVPGCCAFVATARPSQATIQSADNSGAFRSMWIRIPGPLLRQRLPDMDKLCNHEIKVTKGGGAIMRALIQNTAEEGANLSLDEAQTFSNALFGTICSVATAAAESIVGKPSVSNRPLIRIYHRATTYIESRLGDSGLTIDSIAHHCHVSVRYLHLAFAASSTTIAAYIRERRLQTCRQALLSPARRHHSIIVIAGDWGLEDPSHFSHAYKARFGIAPREDRRLNMKVDDTDSDCGSAVPSD